MSIIKNISYCKQCEISGEPKRWCTQTWTQWACPECNWFYIQNSAPPLFEKKNPGIRIQRKKNKIFTKGIQKKRPILPFVRCDLSTGTRNTRIKIKCFPKPIYAVFAGSGTNVEKHTDIWLKFRHQHKCICSQEELSTPATWERMHWRTIDDC